MTDQKGATMTEATIVDTGVPRTAAAHVILAPASTSAPQRHTVVWSTRTFVCVDFLLGDPGHEHDVRQPADQVPQITDTSGVGDWKVLVAAECHTCGTMILPPVALVDGHLTGDELAEIARHIDEQADDDYGYYLAEVTERLEQDLEDVVDELIRRRRTLDDLPDPNSMDTPGVGWNGDELVAMGMLPDGSDVTITRRPPRCVTTGDRTAQVAGPDGEPVTIDVDDPPDWLDLAQLYDDARDAGDTDLVEMLEALHWKAIRRS